MSEQFSYILKQARKILWLWVLVFGLITIAHYSWKTSHSLQAESMKITETRKADRFVTHLKLHNLNSGKAEPWPLGQPMIVHIWSSWCPTCSVEHQLWSKLAKDIRLPLVSISYKDRVEQVLRTLNKKGDPYSKHYSIDSVEAALLGVLSVPEIMLIDAEGRVIARKRGPLSTNDWQVDPPMFLFHTLEAEQKHSSQDQESEVRE